MASTLTTVDSSFIGNGTFGYVFRLGKDRVVKVPKIFSGPDNTDFNWMNRSALKTEKEIYDRLGPHKGIIQCFEAQDERLVLAFAEQGSLSTYIQNNPEPPLHKRAKWIASLVDTFAYAHSCRVIVQDIDLQNILIHNEVLKLSDFGQSFILPQDTDMEAFCINDTTPQIEILHLGCILYSISTWIEYKYYYFDENRWPRPEELPEIDGILYASVIHKCWEGGYKSMEAVKKDLVTVLES